MRRMGSNARLSYEDQVIIEGQRSVCCYYSIKSDPRKKGDDLPIRADLKKTPRKLFAVSANRA